MRVFRDRTALPAGDDTWPALRERLGRSRWLVLLASPDAAASPWVALEVEWWRTYHSVGGTIKKLIIVRTAGDLRWTGTDVDWAATTCLPEEALGGAFKEEQTWAELPRTGGTPYPRLLPLALGGGYVPGYGERMVPTTRRRRPSCVRRSST